MNIGRAISNLDWKVFNMKFLFNLKIAYCCRLWVCKLKCSESRSTQLEFHWKWVFGYSSTRNDLRKLLSDFLSSRQIKSLYVFLYLDSINILTWCYFSGDKTTISTPHMNAFCLNMFWTRKAKFSYWRWAKTWYSHCKIMNFYRWMTTLVQGIRRRRID